MTKVTVIGKATPASLMLADAFEEALNSKTNYFIYGDSVCTLRGWVEGLRNGSLKPGDVVRHMGLIVDSRVYEIVRKICAKVQKASTVSTTPKQELSA